MLVSALHHAKVTKFHTLVESTLVAHQVMWLLDALNQVMLDA